MSAIAYDLSPEFIDGPLRRHPTPALRVVSGRRHGHSRPAAVYLRRRIFCAAVATVLVVMCSQLLTAGGSWAWHQFSALGHDTQAPSSPLQLAGVRAGHAVMVHKGDTVWSLVRQVHPSGDIRPIVADLTRARGGADLQVGDTLTIP